MKTIVMLCIFLGSAIENAIPQVSPTGFNKPGGKIQSVTVSVPDPASGLNKVSGFYPLNGFLPASLSFESEYLSLTDTSQISWFDILYSIAMQNATGINSLQVSKALSSINFNFSYKNAWQNLKIMPPYRPYLKYYDLINRSPWTLNTRYINDTFWSTLLRELYMSTSHHN